jgi:peptidoglycan-associated lipoprotein
MPLVRRVLRKAPALALALAVTPWLTGCPPPYPKCKDDSNCASHGEVCVDGTCKECRADSECKPGFTCQDGACIRKKLAPGTCNTDADCPAGQSCDHGHCVAPVPDGGPAEEDAGVAEVPDAGPHACDLQEVRFDFNEFALTAEARAALEKDADCVRQMHRKVTIEGNCDERGTEEYNLVLGEKRADAVRRYLVGLGVNESDLKTVSYGKERPRDPGHTEAAWAANRRAELVWR